ncbi:hypothetical protein OZX68_06845 [Streptococcaceae bacterium ESL0729]|nr:hypothetical protein OZX68_06845 [Streptococcaceae bacterium ESL0729]
MKNNFLKKNFLVLVVFLFCGFNSLSIQALESSNSVEPGSINQSIVESSQSEASTSSLDQSSSNSWVSQDTSSMSDNSSSIGQASSEEPEASLNDDQSSTMVSPRISYSVGSVADLVIALALPTVDTINLTNNINLGAGAYSIPRNLTINGDKNDGMGGRWTITYGQPGSSGSPNLGLVFGANNLTITLMNVNFGVQAALGSNSQTNANNNYGIIAPGGTGSGRAIIAQNIGYYSDYGAQPFYLPAISDSLTLSGNNTFIMGGGSGSQEFAETCNITFSAGSTTNITDTNTENSGFIWAYNTGLNMQVGAGATVNISSKHDFIYSGYNPVINIADGGVLNFTTTTPKSGNSNGRLIYQDGLSPTITLGVGSKFSAQTALTSVFQNMTVNQGRDSEVYWSSASGQAITTQTNSYLLTFNINNASRLSFQGTSGKVAGNNLRINFSTFSNGTTGYDAFVGSNPNPLLTQTNTNYWTVASGGNFTRNTTNFAPAEVTALNGATKLVLERRTPVLLSWADGSIVSSKSVTTAIGDFGDHLYWRDQGANRNLTFRIFDSSNNQVGPDFTGATTDGTTNYHSFTYYILSANIPVGSYTFTIRVYKTTSNGQKVEDTTGPPLTLNLTVTDPPLVLVSAPTNLSWTNRTMSQSMGILTRDTGNTISVTVNDVRPTPQHWVLKTLVSGFDEYALLWKADSGSSPVDLDYQTVFTNNDVSRDGSNNYTKTWAEDVGVLAYTGDYLSIGSYSNVTITWLLAVTP